jgi:hypothetical protein
MTMHRRFGKATLRLLERQRYDLCTLLVWIAGGMLDLWTKKAHGNVLEAYICLGATSCMKHWRSDPRQVSNMWIDLFDKQVPGRQGHSHRRHQ